MASRKKYIFINNEPYEAEDDIILHKVNAEDVPHKRSHKSRSLTAVLASLAVGTGIFASQKTDNDKELPTPPPAKETLVPFEFLDRGEPEFYANSDQETVHNNVKTPTQDVPQSFEEVNEIVQQTEYAKIYTRLKEILPSNVSTNSCSLYAEVLEHMTTVSSNKCTAAKLSDDSLAYFSQMAQNIPTNQLSNYVHNLPTQFSFDRLQSTMRLSPEKTDAIAQQAFLQSSRYSALERASAFLCDPVHENCTNYLYCDRHRHPTLDVGLNVDGPHLGLLSQIRFNITKDTYRILFPEDKELKNYSEKMYLSEIELKHLKNNAKDNDLGDGTPARTYYNKYKLTVCEEDMPILIQYRNNLLAQTIRLAETTLDRDKPATLHESGLYGSINHPVPNGAIDNMIDFKWQRPYDYSVHHFFLTRNWKALNAPRASKTGERGGFLFSQHPDRNAWKSQKLEQAIDTVKKLYRRDMNWCNYQHQQRYLRSLKTNDPQTPTIFLNAYFKEIYALAQNPFYYHTIFAPDRMKVFKSQLPQIVDTLWPNATKRETEQHIRDFTKAWQTLDTPKQKSQRSM